MVAGFFLIGTYTPEAFSTDTRSFMFAALDSTSKVGYIYLCEVACFPCLCLLLLLLHPLQRDSRSLLVRNVLFRIVYNMKFARSDLSDWCMQQP